MRRVKPESLAEGAVVANAARRRRRFAVEWPTYVALAGCYAAWLTVTYAWEWLPLLVFMPLAAYCVALQSSLRHEALHGHPTRSIRLNEALVFAPLCLLIPYRRFRDTHLRHHFDARLTDPYDDPETWFLAERDWEALPRLLKLVLRANNTLAGRLILGPPLSVFGLVRHDLKAIAAGDRRIAGAWALHLAGCLPVVLWLALVAGVPVWAYLLAASWPGLSLLMLRTYAEHQAHPEVPQRTAIIEASPVFSFLFLNNNLHYLHHKRPRVPWYELPQLYREDRERLMQENGGYGFAGYLDLARRHLLRGREPVPHPFLRRGAPVPERRESS
jgi:fatty acid desaturase